MHRCTGSPSWSPSLGFSSRDDFTADRATRCPKEDSYRCHAAIWCGGTESNRHFHVAVMCCHYTTTTCARSVPASSVARFRCATSFSESARSLVAMRYACPAGCTLYTAWFGSWCGRVESNHLSYRTNTVHKPCSCLLPHMAPARLAECRCCSIVRAGGARRACWFRPWSGKRASNPQPSAWKADALPN